MAFNINELKKAASQSGNAPAINIDKILRFIVDSEDFEDKLQSYLQECISRNRTVGRLFLSFFVSSNGLVHVMFTSEDHKIYYSLTKNKKVNPYEIVATRYGLDCIYYKLHELGLKRIAFNHNDGMGFGRRFDVVRAASSHSGAYFYEIIVSLADFIDRA